MQTLLPICQSYHCGNRRVKEYARPRLNLHGVMLSTGSHDGRGRVRLTDLGVSVPQRGRCAAAWDLVGHCLSRLAPPLPLPAVRLLPSIRIGRSGCAAREWAQQPVILPVFRRTSMVCRCRAGAAFLCWSGARRLRRSRAPSSAGRTAGSCRRAPRLREHPSSAMLS